MLADGDLSWCALTKYKLSLFSMPQTVRSFCTEKLLVIRSDINSETVITNKMKRFLYFSLVQKRLLRALSERNENY